MEEEVNYKQRMEELEAEVEQNLKELKRLKNRRKTNCDGVNCIFNRESGRDYNKKPIMCDHLEALMMTVSRERVRELLTQLLPN